MQTIIHKNKAMFKLKIYSVGKTKELWLKLAIEEYEKRLKSFMSIEWLFFKNFKDLEKRLLKQKAFICLDLHAKQYNSEDFSKIFFSSLDSNICFVIGDDKGISKNLLQNSLLNLSLSKLTFTHQMTRLILIEQIYRALKISQKTKYHK